LLKRGLAFGYRSKTKADLTNEWQPEAQQRRVVRRVSNTFWFLREVRRYGSDCILISPDDVRDKIVEEIKQMLRTYPQAHETSDQ
jgi:predicted DNA-binding transcriptional regulator YafY